MSLDTLLKDFNPPTKIADGVVFHIDVDRASLEKALVAVSGVVPNKHHQPVLTNVHFLVTPGDLRLTGTNGSITMIHHVSVYSTHSEGAAVFPVTKILPLVRDAEGDLLKIKVTSKKANQVATISTERTKWEMSLVSAQHFPVVEEEQHQFSEVNRLGLMEALQRVRKSASADTMRPYLMLVDFSKGRVRASDSSRFSQVKFAYPFDCQVPVATAHEVVQRLASSNLENVEVAQTETSLLYRFGKTLMVSQKTNATFPDIDEVMLKPVLGNDQDLTVSRKALLAAIKRTRISADEETSAVVLSLNHGAVSVQTKDYRGSTAVETVDATWDYSPRHISFNHQHLTELLSSTSSDNCTFRLGKELKTRPTPLLMEDEGEGFTAVLNQIRVDWMD